MNISPGRFQMLLSLSAVLSKDGPQSKDSLGEIMPFWYPSSNVGLLDGALNIGVSVELFSESASEISITPAWRKKEETAVSEIAFARMILQKIVTVHFPDLIALSFLPIRKARNEVDGNMRAILDDCRLLEMELDDDAKDWWEHLRSLGQFKADSSKKEIGTDAEKLSVSYEVAFLSSRGVPNAASHVSWVAEHNDRAGFDVLSLNHGRVSEFNDEASLRIEVKVGRREGSGRFSLMFTRHEHRVMTSDSMPWLLQVWLHKQGVAQFEADPVTVSKEAVLALIPETPAEFEWETARLTFHGPRLGSTGTLSEGN